jgi:hypothetical protein
LVLPACKQATPSLTATFAQSVKQWTLLGSRLGLLRISQCV